MRKRVTAQMVWTAHNRWLNKPCVRTRTAYHRLRRSYEDRWPNRRLDIFNRRVEIGAR